MFPVSAMLLTIWTVLLVNKLTLKQAQTNNFSWSSGEVRSGEVRSPPSWSHFFFTWQELAGADRRWEEFDKDEVDRELLWEAGQYLTAVQLAWQLLVIYRDCTEVSLNIIFWSKPKCDNYHDWPPLPPLIAFIFLLREGNFEPLNFSETYIY